MKLLLDTHLLLWAAGLPHRLPVAARALIADPETQPVFSVASVWEIVIKRGLGRPDFQIEPRQFRRNLIDNGYAELAISGEHTLAVESLPALHRDPFDRMLVAQAMVEGLSLLTVDETVARYGGPVRKV